MKRIIKLVKTSDFLLDRTNNSTRNQGSHLGLLSYLTDRSKSAAKTAGHIHTTLGQLAIKSQMPRKFLSESLRLFEHIGLVEITHHLGANQYWDIFPTPQATQALELLQTNHNVDLLAHFNVAEIKPIELIETKQPADPKDNKKSSKKSKGGDKSRAKNKARKKLKKQKTKAMSRAAQRISVMAVGLGSRDS